MRSCSLSVLMHKTTKQIASLNSGRLDHAAKRRSDGWFRRPQPERPVGVVVLQVDPQHLLKVAAPEDQQPVQALARTVRIQRSACALAFGACTGVISISAPSAHNTSSKLRENFASRSRSTKRNRRRCSPSTGSRLRAC